MGELTEGRNRYSHRTAEHLMQIYRQFEPKLASPGEGLSETKTFSNLSYSQVSCLVKDITIEAYVEAEDYIYNTRGQCPVVRLTPKAVPVLRSQTRVLVRMPKTPEPVKQDSDIFDMLRSLRKEIAQKEGMPRM